MKANAAIYQRMERHERKRAALRRSDEVRVESIKLVCPLCHEFLNRATATECGHMFCQVCLLEFTVYKDACPVCDKPVKRDLV